MSDGAGARRKRDPLPLRAEINVTSLVDVAFTLLVIFIITAPVLQGGVEVDLPQGRVGQVEVTEELIIVTVQRDGSTFLGDTPVGDVSEARGILSQMLAARPEQKMIYLKGDSAAMYGWMAEIVSVVAEHEGVGLSLIMEGEVER